MYNEIQMKIFAEFLPYFYPFVGNNHHLPYTVNSLMRAQDLETKAFGGALIREAISALLWHILQNENWTIFGGDTSKNVGCGGSQKGASAPLLENLRYFFQTPESQVEWDASHEKIPNDLSHCHTKRRIGRRRQSFFWYGTNFRGLKILKRRCHTKRRMTLAFQKKYFSKKSEKSVPYQK